MQANLKVTSGPGAGRITVIRPGQVLQVGRTSWAGFTVAEDDSMGDIHFSIAVTYDKCHLRHLADGLATEVNGAPAEETELADGDQIRAGRTLFALALEGAPVQTTEDDESAAGEAVTSGYKHVEIALAQDIAAKCELSDEVLPLMNAKTTAREFLESLIEASQFDDAIVFLAAALPKREAVWWACQCCGAQDASGLPPGDERAIEAAKQWVIEPSEENRRTAEDAANAGQFLTAPSCVALAAFLSGGSIAPPGGPEIAPGEHLTGHTVGCAVKFAATSGDAMKIDETKRRLLDLGIQIAEGDNRWE